MALQKAARNHLSPSSGCGHAAVKKSSSSTREQVYRTDGIYYSTLKTQLNRLRLQDEDSGSILNTVFGQGPSE